MERSGVVVMEGLKAYGQGKSPKGLVSGEVGPSSQNHDSEDSASESKHDGIKRDRGLSDNS